MRIDGKHSFQDNVQLVAQAKQLYGERVALMGGVDVDNLTRLAPTDLRRYVRSVIDAGAPGGLPWGQVIPLPVISRWRIT